jgi:hypothetical protein
VKRTLTVAALTAAATIGTAWAAEAATLPTTNSSGAVGNPARYASAWNAQTTGNCVEDSAYMAMAGIASLGSHSSPSLDAVDNEAYRLGITNGAFDGSSFDANNANLFRAFGFKATFHQHTSKATVMADLAKGDSVQVALYAADIWNGRLFSDGQAWGDANSAPTPDHAVVVESINRTTGAVTLGDTGGPLTQYETVPWSVFSKAWSVGGYVSIVVVK